MTEQHCKHYFSWKRQGISVQLWTDMLCMLAVQLGIKKLENQQFNIHQESCSWLWTPEKPSRSLRSTGECGRKPPPFKYGEEEEQMENVKSASPMTTWTPKKPQQKLFFLLKFRFAGIPSQMLKKTTSWILRIPLPCLDSLFWPCPKKSTQTSTLQPRTSKHIPYYATGECWLHNDAKDSWIFCHLHSFATSYITMAKTPQK